MGVIRMVGSTGKRYGEEFKLMILEMHKTLFNLKYSEIDI
jgi:hypothetical protein